VSSFERLVVLRLGRAMIKGPGTTCTLTFIDRCTRIDLRLNAFHVAPLQVITPDRGVIELGATVHLQIRDALVAVLAIQDRDHAIRTLARTILYRHVSKQRISDISNAHRRKLLALRVQEELSTTTKKWGVEIVEVTMSDPKVIKEAENMALNMINRVFKSEMGSRLMSEHITPVLQNLAMQQGQSKEQLIDVSTPPGLTKEQLIDVSTPPDLDLDQLISRICLVLDRDLVQSINQVYQVDCLDLGLFFVDLKHGDGSAGRGQHPHPTVTFSLDQTTLNGLITGSHSPTQAYMTGRLKVNGDLSATHGLRLLADRLSSLL